MRQIVTQIPWSGSSRSYAGRTLKTTGSNGSKGETDSSFEVPGSSYERRQKSLGNNTGASMQFVPADHHTENRYVESAETSWDVVANDSPGYGNTVTSSSSLRTKHRNFRNKTRSNQHRSEAASAVDERAGSKIGRLASMFSSRAATPEPAPASPIRSESSTGYMGWPGTQDKQGDTVMPEQSSYEESEASSRIEHEPDKVHRMQMHGQFTPRINPGYIPNDDNASDCSKTSSAYFNHGEVQAIRKGNASQVFGASKNRVAASAVIRRRPQPESSQPVVALTEEALAMKNRFTAPNRNFTNGAAAGYRGLLDRTKDVPNLLDDATSVGGASAISDHMSTPNFRTEQKETQRREQLQHVDTIEEDEDYNEGRLGAASRTGGEKLNLALLGGGLTTIQTTFGDFHNRKTAEDFDEALTNSDCDENGFVRIPAFHEMLSAGMNKNEQSFTAQSLDFVPKTQHQHQVRKSQAMIKKFDFASGQYQAQPAYVDFSKYYVDPDVMQVLVKKFRKISDQRSRHLDYEELEREEDATKAFALSEMRSRIMEKDIERGLERRGGTTAVDDIVMTSYHRAALRVRDAVIVAKAWRDGATPQDIINTANLTRREDRSYYIPRWDRVRAEYTWEEVTWVDDNDLTQYRCHSLGPRHLKGSEMFTIGDCQSILLKLSHERCQELRADLNYFTEKQIEAEIIMKQQGNTFDGKMTQAEMNYLTLLEEVKSIAQNLVRAEKSFGIVKKRIEKLVQKYEALLVHFENESDSVAPSSVFSYESSCYTDYSYTAAQKREEATLARKARRAELSAELAARESMLSIQRTMSGRREAQMQVNNLKDRIAELQSETSNNFADRNRSAVLARAITSSRVGAGQKDNRSKINDIKARFRNRAAAKSSKPTVTFADQVPIIKTPVVEAPRTNNFPVNSFQRTVGEEMFQQLDFYERSLKAVGQPCR